MGITQRPFGHTADGRAVTCWRLVSPSGCAVEVIDYGGATRSVELPLPNGTRRGVCLGFDCVQDYESSTTCAGAIVGRCAGRIAHGRFPLNKREVQLSVNCPPDHLHGGFAGFHRQVWQGAAEGERLRLRHTSPDGTEGYPGTAEVSAVYEWTADSELTLTLEAVCDRDTPLSLTHHGYWNLSGEDTVGNHRFFTPATAFVEAGPRLLPTGALLPVEGTPFDFRAPQSLGGVWDAPHPQILSGCGFDHTFPVSGSGLRELGRLSAPDGSLALTISSTLPALHLYTGVSSHAALEAQFIPDAVHHPEFPSVILPVGQAWRHSIVFSFAR